MCCIGEATGIRVTFIRWSLAQPRHSHLLFLPISCVRFTQQKKKWTVSVCRCRHREEKESASRALVSTKPQSQSALATTNRLSFTLFKYTRSLSSIGLYIQWAQKTGTGGMLTRPRKRWAQEKKKTTTANNPARNWLEISQEAIFRQHEEEKKSICPLQSRKRVRSVYMRKKKRAKIIVCLNSSLGLLQRFTKKNKNNSTTHCGDYIKMPTRETTKTARNFNSKRTSKHHHQSRRDFLDYSKSLQPLAQADMNNWGRTLAAPLSMLKISSDNTIGSLAPPKWMKHSISCNKHFSFLLSSLEKQHSNFEHFSISFHHFFALPCLAMGCWAGKRNWKLLLNASSVCRDRFGEIRGQRGTWGSWPEMSEFRMHSRERERVHVQQRRDCGSEPSHGRECH